MTAKRGKKTGIKDNICMNCLGDFSDNEIYWVRKNDYQVLNCFDCIEEKGIIEFTPYLKPRKTGKKSDKKTEEIKTTPVKKNIKGKAKK